MKILLLLPILLLFLFKRKIGQNKRVFSKFDWRKPIACNVVRAFGISAFFEILSDLSLDANSFFSERTITVLSRI